jgi:preprotein translocase SecE subunit
VRIGTAVGAALVILILSYYSWVMMERNLPTDASFADLRPYVLYAVPTIILAGLGVLTGYYLNKPNFVDFLIATESEMKKVSWSNRAELLGSTSVVIITVFLMAIIIFVADYMITSGLSKGWLIPFTQVRIPGLGLW